MLRRSGVSIYERTEVRDALIRQVTGAVRWVECIRLLQQDGATHYIEVGPGKVLTGLNRQIDRDFGAARASARILLYFEA